jgi:acetyltransferase-like isoleucine patch superfamily enzyme
MSARLPVPNFLLPLFRLFYHAHMFVRGLWIRAVCFLYREPLFRARCERAGNNLLVTLLPDISSNVRVYVGNNVSLHGHMGVMAGRLFDPRLEIQDNVHIGHWVTFTINREVVIEEGVMIASGCFFADTDAHPIDPVARVSGKPPSPENVLPIRVKRNAWIGHASHILKGVTVGEAAIVAAGSVVVKDVPPYTIVAGNPARVVATVPGGPASAEAAAPPSS